MTTITAAGNQKGGVGKTTVVLGLAGALTLLGRRVAVCDLDPQANATSVLAPDSYDPSRSFTMYDLLMADEPGLAGDALMESHWPNVSLIPGHRSLTEFERSTIMGPDTRLRDAFDGADLSAYDDVLIDMPPQVGRLTINGLAAANRVLTVTSAVAFSVDGIGEFIDTTEHVRRRLNRSLTPAGVLVNDYDSTFTEHQARLAELRDADWINVLDTVIPSRVAALRMESFRLPLHKFPRSATGAPELSAAFVSLANELTKEK